MKLGEMDDERLIAESNITDNVSLKVIYGTLP